MILVTGAIGNFGSAAITHLLKKGVPASEIAALVRNMENTGPLEKLGVDLRIGNYNDVDSMVKGFAGIEQLLLVSSSDRGAIENRTKHHINAITAAREANVRHITYTSFIRKEGHEKSAIAGFQNSHFETEQFLKDSGVTYTVLQNGIYQEMIFAFAGAKVAETHTIFFPAQQGKAGWVLRDELAEAAAHVLTTEGHNNKTYILTNTVSTGFEQISAYISERINKEVKYTTPDTTTFRAVLENSGVLPMYINMMTMWGAAIAEGALDLENNTLELLLGRKPKNVQEFIGEIFN
jgi:NAD(P)H dehydrogenase (quinone)